MIRRPFRDKIISYGTLVLAVLFFVSIMVWSVWTSIEVWDECRATHSFFYCTKLMSK